MNKTDMYYAVAYRVLAFVMGTLFASYWCGAHAVFLGLCLFCLHISNAFLSRAIKDDTNKLYKEHIDKFFNEKSMK